MLNEQQLTGIIIVSALFLFFQYFITYKALTGGAFTNRFQVILCSIPFMIYPFIFILGVLIIYTCIVESDFSQKIKKSWAALGKKDKENITGDNLYQ